MAATQNPTGPDSADAALDRLEAALETIALRLQASRPMEEPAGSEVVGEVEQRLDAAIDYAKAALGRKSDQ
ncbi:MAG TPA: hypothetical protein VFG62_11205 [Rhodopila sp.]|nr:hypothetical protein [Rhodopila sp.]